jgi:hypothetical protein
MVRANHADEDVFQSFGTGSQLGHGAGFHQPSVVDDGYAVAQAVKGLPRDLAHNPKYMEGFGG